MASSDIVARWEVPLPDGLHVVEFEHGTTSGKRVIWVNKREIYRADWNFKLVGRETFKLGNKTCVITIDAVSGFEYEYTLKVDGKSLQKFQENQKKSLKVWKVRIGECDHRICLDTDLQDVWVNGDKMDCCGSFLGESDGAERHFIAAGHSGCVRAVSSGIRRKGIIHKLFIDEHEVPESSELKHAEQCHSKH